MKCITAAWGPEALAQPLNFQGSPKRCSMFFQAVRAQRKRRTFWLRRGSPQLDNSRWEPASLADGQLHGTYCVLSPV